VHVLATGDMHGWLENQSSDGQTVGGAAEMLAYWKRMEGYTPKGFLVLGCGDFNTGQALATTFQGDPTVEVMNAMGYDACALGNHEFDNGVGRIPHWAEMARFPFVVANLTKKDDKQPDLAVPYLINDEQGVKVGVIGLITYGLDELRVKAGNYTIAPYADTLRKYVPEVRAKGAQMIIVVSHIPKDDLKKLAESVADLNIPLMLGGHDHELTQTKVKNTWVVNNGLWWDSYSRIDLDWNAKTGKATVLVAKQVWLQQENTNADKAVADIIKRWRARFSDEYETVLGYTTRGLMRQDGIYNFINDITLAMTPDADVALTNNGGLRSDIPSGKITKATIISVMPFNNALTRINITGAQLLEYLPQGEFIGIAGLRYDGKQYLSMKTGKPVEPAASYTVLLNSFMYATSDLLKQADPKPQQAYADWRQPVFAWLAKHPTSKEQPLDALVDITPRILK
jgi:2',3'-cyclic-nucleotide 2'-phosphodiesterase (5'-nucleotidase family)